MRNATPTLVIRGGTVATATRAILADVAIAGGQIVAIGPDLPAAASEIDATGRYVLPGGVDSHCHIEQVSGAGLMNADTWESATRSAAFGGTTTVVSFAAQHPGKRIRDVVTDYAGLAARGALVDHAFHIIVADISGENLSHDIPHLIGQGHRSLKIFTTYDKVRLEDHAILDVLATARQHGALVCFHAENDGLIRHMTARLLAEGNTAPKHHAASHPRLAEIEALERMCRFSGFTGQPIMLFHISTREGAEIVHSARAAGLKVSAETCPHYLFMTEDVLDKPEMAGAAFMCSPPQRSPDDQAALWQALATGDLQIVSSDHAPYRMDQSGKFANGAEAPFNRIANGMPGLETRLPLMFNAMVSEGRIGIEAFVRLTATAPAEIFGLTGKGRIEVGADADIAIWNPVTRRTFGANDLHDNVGYNPFEGFSVTGWPETVLSRGDVIVDNGAVLGEPGRGRHVPMACSDAMRPSGPALSRT